MSKHTPGPWKVVTNGNPLCSGIVAVIEHSPDRLLTVEEDHYGGPWCAPETWTANASLIAAAPDLLAELENIANADPSKWDLEMRGQFREWAQSRARHAIAKAEGRGFPEKCEREK